MCPADVGNGFRDVEDVFERHGDEHEGDEGDAFEERGDADDAEHLDWRGYRFLGSCFVKGERIHRLECNF